MGPNTRTSLNSQPGQIAAITWRWSGKTWSRTRILIYMPILKSILEQICSGEKLERCGRGWILCFQPHLSVGWESHKCSLSGILTCHFTGFIPGSDCHFTYEHGDVQIPTGRDARRGAPGQARAFGRDIGIAGSVDQLVPQG